MARGKGIYRDPYGVKWEVYSCRQITLQMDEGLRYYHIRAKCTKRNLMVEFPVDHLELPRKIQKHFRNVKRIERGHF